MRSASWLMQVAAMTGFSVFFNVLAADATAGAAEVVVVVVVVATPELLRVRRDDVVFWPGQRLPIDFAVQLPTALADAPFVIDHVGFSCHCASVITVPAQLTAAAAGTFTMSIHAPEKPMPYGGTATLAGLRNERPATIVCVASGRVLDLIAWPDAEPLLDLGERAAHATPITTELILNRGPHPLAWDTVSVRVSVVDGVDGPELRLCFTAVAPLGPAPGRVELTLSDGSVLRVPYIAAVVAEKVRSPAAAAAAAATAAP